MKHPTTSSCHRCNSSICDGARYCSHCGSAVPDVSMDSTLPPEHEDRIAPIIKKLGSTASLVYSKPKPYAKSKWATTRYDLVIEGTAAADQVRRVYWHYARVDDIETAMKEADKINGDIKYDTEHDYYKLESPSND